MKKDEFPNLSEKGLKKFFEHGYDSELGWIRKPNTLHSEIGKNGQTKWTVNSKGFRTNPEYDNLESKISCYGDSFVFCRQVNDNETWEYYLSQLQNTNVLNLGVGNYGIDQALIRMKREYSKNKTPVVVLAVVPETICRIVSVWKHYYEYGNTFGFKPRFIIKNEKLELIKNQIDSRSKFFEYKKYLNIIQKNDFFYKKKFQKEKINFPYSLSILKNFRRNLSIIYWVLKIQRDERLEKKDLQKKWNLMKIIMKINLKWRVKLYQNQKITALLKKIIEEYVTFSQENQFKPVFLLLPQKDDIIFIKNNYHFYKEFVEDLSQINGLNIIDITDEILKESNLDDLYSDNNNYGGHFSSEGNKKISLLINQKLSSLKII